MVKGLPALRRRKPSPGPNCRRPHLSSSQRLRQKGGRVANILVCDDERSICEMLDIALRRDGHRVETVQSGQAAKNKLDSALLDVIITDIKMPNVDGIEVLRHAHRVSPDSPVILITAVDDYEAAVEAVKAGGASDYIRKSPGLVDEIKLAINRVLEKLSLSKQNFALRRDAASHNSLDNIIGSSAAMEKLKQTVRTVASTASTVLIHGESGTGKELVARAVHICSPRATEPFVSVNCGAFPETLLESELFGYLKGAFTGANQNKRGLFEVAGGGTIFLDEISEMTLAMQVKLLRVLQERTVRPVGGTSEITIDVRVELPAERTKARAAAAGAGASGMSEIAPGAVLPQGVGMEVYVADIERTLLQSALDRSNGVQTKAADLLSISYRSFRHLMKKYEL